MLSVRQVIVEAPMDVILKQLIDHYGYHNVEQTMKQLKKPFDGATPLVSTKAGRKIKEVPNSGEQS